MSKSNGRTNKAFMSILAGLLTLTILGLCTPCFANGIYSQSAPQSALKSASKARIIKTQRVQNNTMQIHSRQKSKAKPVLTKRKITLRVGGASIIKVRKTSKRVKWTLSGKKCIRLTNKRKHSVRIRALKRGRAKVFAKIGQCRLTCIVIIKAAKAANNDEKRKADITVLYTNDVHCGINDNIGYAGLALYKKQMLEKSPYVTLVDAGDAVQGAAIGTLTKGEGIIKIMNQVGYDFAIPGNHEFDYGMEAFLSLSQKLNCGYYSANFIDTTSQKSLLKPYRIIKYADTKVAYIGVTTPATLSSSNPKSFQDTQGNYIYSFCEDESGQLLYKRVQSTIDTVQKAGADYVILVTHLGESGSRDIWTSDAVIKNTTGVDACIDGHSHEQISSKQINNKNGDSVLLTQTGTKLDTIGELTIDTDGQIENKLVDKIPVSDSATIIEDGRAIDAGTQAFIANLENEFKTLLGAIIGTTKFDMVVNDPSTETRIIRNHETNLGDFAADAIRSMTNSDIGLCNGGGIRADIPAGNITYNNAYTVFPFGNTVCVVEATGQQIMDCLEMGARKFPDENGEFMQVSGMSYEIDVSTKSSVVTDEKGNFVSVSGDYRVKNVKVGGEPIDLNKTYSLASVNYFLKSYGGGMIMFEKSKLIGDEVMTDLEAFVNYIGYLGGTLPDNYQNTNGEGRIVITGAPAQTMKATTFLSFVLPLQAFVKVR